MVESTTVVVGLDAHARSIRLAAVRGTSCWRSGRFPTTKEQVERLLRRWPGARCCYEAGPTGFGLYRYLVGRGIDCQVVAPGLVPAAAGRPGEDGSAGRAQAGAPAGGRAAGADPRAIARARGRPRSGACA
jgi:transposase